MANRIGKKILLLGLFAAFIHSASAQSEIPAVNFELQNAISGGNGCSQLGTLGSSLSIKNDTLEFRSSEMGLYLGFAGSDDLSSRSHCAIRIPYQVPVGYYIKKISSRLIYGVLKTQGARGSVSATVAASEIVSSPQIINFPLGEKQDEYYTTNAFQVEANEEAAQCHNHKGILKINIATSGQIENLEDKLIIENIFGEVKLLTRFNLEKCD